MNKKTTKVLTEEVKPVRTRKYIFVEDVYEDGRRRLRRTNDGFSPIELLGLLELTRADIISALANGYPKPDEITRQFVKD